MTTLEVSIHREGFIVIIDGTQASVTFHPKNKDRTFKALLEKCVELDRGYSTDLTALEHLKRSLDIQLTKIYQDFNARVAEKTEEQKDTRAPKKIQLAPSQEAWQQTILQKYEHLKEVTEMNFPGIWPSIEFALAASRILHIKDITLPFMGIILGPPSSSKTLALECMRGSDHTFYTDGFTPRSFVSHNSGLSEEQLQEIDLLPKLQNNTFLTPELATIFTAKDDEITNLFGIITRVLDGHGYESDTGAQGHRGYSGDYMFVWIGAVVEIPRKVHRILGALGPKMYFYRLNVEEKSEEAYQKEMKDDNFVIRKAAVKAALLDYLEYFDTNPAMQEVSTLRKVAWTGAEEAEEVRAYVVKLAKLLARLRGSIPTWDTHDAGGAQYAYSLPTIEEPSRAMTQLRNLARGHALSQGRTYVTLQDLQIVVNVVLSTAPSERVAVFSLLLAMKGVLKTSDIKRALNTTNPTAKRAMVELKALGLVDMPDDSESSNKELTITLKDDFKWFLSDEFSNLRDGLLKANHPPRRGTSATESENDPLRGDGISFSVDESTAERNPPPTQALSSERPADREILLRLYEKAQGGGYRCPVCPRRSYEIQKLVGYCKERDPSLQGHMTEYELRRRRGTDSMRKWSQCSASASRDWITNQAAIEDEKK